jgi:hypothetical protein
MEKQIIITMSPSGELNVQKKGLVYSAEIVGLLELVKHGEIMAALAPPPAPQPEPSGIIKSLR